MKIKLVDKDTYQSEDGRIVIRRVLEDHVYYRGSYRKIAKKPDTLYDIYVDGNKLYYSEYQLKDAKEMAMRKIKEIDNAKKKETERIQHSRADTSSTITRAHGDEKPSSLHGSSSGESN
jgi:hypothetical protein